MSLTSLDMEQMAENLRKNDLGLKKDEPLNPFDLEVSGVSVFYVKKLESLSSSSKRQLLKEDPNSWSAMSFPTNSKDSWAIVINDTHEIERQRVSLLEELWHIIQDHKLTSITKIGGYYGRSFDKENEHDAYYLATATLVPKKGLKERLEKKESIEKVASYYGVSKELIEYRIKRLGFWYKYKKRVISLRIKP